MQPVSHLITREESHNLALSCGLRYYKSCFPFDESITKKAIQCLETTETDVYRTSHISCVEPLEVIGWKVKLSYRGRMVDVMISKETHGVHKEPLLFFAEPSMDVGFSKELMDFVLKQVKNKLPQKLRDVQIVSIKREYLDRLCLARELVEKNGKKSTHAVEGWIVRIAAGLDRLKLSVYETPNEIKWRIKEKKLQLLRSDSDEESSNKAVKETDPETPPSQQPRKSKIKKRHISGDALRVKMEEKRNDPARLGQIQTMPKEDVLPIELFAQLKVQALQRLSYAYPFASIKMEEIVFERPKWRSDFPAEVFTPKYSHKSPRALKVSGYQIPFTYHHDRFEIICDNQGSAIFKGLDQLRPLPSSALHELRKAERGNPACFVISYEVQTCGHENHDSDIVLEKPCFYLWYSVNGEQKLIHDEC